MTQQTLDTEKTTPAEPSSPNGYALTSLVLGILSFTGFGALTGIPAIVFGIISLRRNERERGMSIAGIIMGAITTIATVLFLLFITAVIAIGLMSAADGSFDVGPGQEPSWLESNET